MKISIALLASSVSAKNWFTKEWQVTAADQSSEDIILSDPTIRSGKQWHDCGNKPPMPWKGKSVECNGPYCVAVCPKGWRSEGHWKIKCGSDNQWSKSNFSQCISCDSISDEVLQEGVNMQMKYVKNLPVMQFNCADATSSMDFKGKTFKNGAAFRNAKCLCKNGQNNDPWWKKSCSWLHKTESFSQTDASEIVCTPKQPDQDALDAANDALDAENAKANAEQ